MNGALLRLLLTRNGLAPSQDEPVIIVGGGLAGLSAALEALDRNSKVIIIDGEKNLGGNSAKASSGVSACETVTQKRMGIQDSKNLFYMDTMNAGDRENDETLVDLLVESSSDAIDFLIGLGVDLSDINLCGGHSVPRTHWIPSPKEGRPVNVGFGIISKAKERILEIQKARPDDVKIMTETRVVGLTSWNAYVNGVNVVKDGKRSEINGKAVILATGGFSADKNEDASLLHEFASDKLFRYGPKRSKYENIKLLLKFPTTNGPWARGDGVKMARAMGAQVIGMDRVQIHPTAFVDPADPAAGTKFLAAEALRGKGAILINSNGVRFANELGRRDYVTGKILHECKPIEVFHNGSAGLSSAIMLMSDEAADSFGRPAFSFYHVVKKFFTKYNTMKDFASAAGIPYEVLKETIEKYNKFVEAGKSGAKEKDAFGKTVFPVAFDLEKPIYAAIITPAIHYTMGGLKINKQVIADRARGPSCVSVAQPDVSELVSEKEAAPSSSAPERDPRAPQRKWCKTKVAEFSVLRSRMEKAPRRSAIKLKWPNMVETLIQYAVEWAECDGFSRALREWLFALLLMVHKPLMPDVCAAMRGLANLCRNLRSSMDMERKDEIRELSWFICIVGEYFGQTDLADL
ncbi:flavocytochrome c [Ancylostoma ceylanicum]|uniref:fumarate reductase (NADH) n=1 Tax=Ancylostoma ceylanicum TaxID=53326 RepID=A0A0D6MAF6_9BILA|nr:flavocytochrome c [Ancylostoma ceylanicum]